MAFRDPYPAPHKQSCVGPQTPPIAYKALLFPLIGENKILYYLRLKKMSVTFSKVY